MNKYFPVILLFCTLNLSSQGQAQHKDYTSKVDSIISIMTLEEKIGQMNQYTNDKKHTGPVIQNKNHLDDIRKGKVGSMLNVISVSRAKQYQDEAMKSRLKIPLLFGLDVVHGMKTIFPIPLGEAASFDLELMKKTAEMAAAEASAYGVHWTFAPVMDVARDARWGRVMEGSGEDTWYASEVAKVRVRGFQGDSYDGKRTVLACAKHFAAYGAAVAGKDYAEADISEHTLHQVYLPPFKAAIDAGVATFMHGFNEINSVPAAANQYLQRSLLKEKWGFDGLVVSDWGSIGELAKHGYAKDAKESALLAVMAGCDIDMCSLTYIRHIENLINEGKLDIALIDDAVKRILTKKFELGLFDDPYCFNNREKDLSDPQIEKEYRNVSRIAGSKSIVLLKNKEVLPLSGSVHKIALVGPLNKSKIDMLGNWRAVAIEDGVVTVLEGLKNALPNTAITYYEGYDLETNELKQLPDMSDFDAIIVSVGERAMESGEAKSKIDLNVNANQQQLVKELKTKNNKPIITLVMSGRPLIFSDMEPYSDAILVTWWLGTEAGNSIADVLTGKYNPSGKLPMTFPQYTGQCPIYYNHKNTGRPWSPKNEWSAGYIDSTPLPAYPFGYGESYTTFEIAAPQLAKNQYYRNEEIHIKTSVKNTGKFKGKETVQLYLRDVACTLTRPVIELCGIKQVELEPGEEKEVNFTLTSKDLGFYNSNNDYITEAGDFIISVGNNSQNLNSIKFELVDNEN